LVFAWEGCDILHIRDAISSHPERSCVIDTASTIKELTVPLLERLHVIGEEIT
jgi:hypothetical protein